MKMQFTTIILIIFVVALAESVNQKEFEGYRNECISKTQVSEELADAAERNKIYTEDPKLKEYMFCIHKKIRYQNEDGSFNLDVIKNVLKPTLKEEEQINKCAIQRSTPQETAYQFLTCVFNKK